MRHYSIFHTVLMFGIRLPRSGFLCRDTLLSRYSLDYLLHTISQLIVACIPCFSMSFSSLSSSCFLSVFTISLNSISSSFLCLGHARCHHCRYSKLTNGGAVQVCSTTYTIRFVSIGSCTEVCSVWLHFISEQNAHVVSFLSNENVASVFR